MAEIRHDQPKPGGHQAGPAPDVEQRAARHERRELSEERIEPELGPRPEPQVRAEVREPPHGSAGVLREAGHQGRVGGDRPQRVDPIEQGTLDPSGEGQLGQAAEHSHGDHRAEQEGAGPDSSCDQRSCAEQAQGSDVQPGA